jgi:ubiquitin C-terminal hydrolase
LTNLIDKFHAAKGKEVFAIFVSAIFQKAILRSSKEVKSQFKMSVSLSKLRTLKGLENNNNTCWIISLLQSLSYLESFTSFFDSFTVKDSGPNCILRLVQNLMNSFRDSKNTNTVLSASGIISILLSKYPDNFQKNRHEDVSEAFLCLLEAMNKDLMTKVVIKNENGKENCNLY